MTFNITQGSQRLMAEGDAYIVINAITNAHQNELGKMSQTFCQLEAQLRKEIQEKTEQIAILETMFNQPVKCHKQKGYQEAPIEYYSLRR